MTAVGYRLGGLSPPGRQGGHGNGDGPRMVAASGPLGTVARHQPSQTDIPSSQSMHGRESVEESLAGSSWS